MLMTQPGNKAEAQARIPLVLNGKDRTLGPCYSPSRGSLTREGQMSIRPRRRELIAVVGAAAVWPLVARATVGGANNWDSLCRYVRRERK